MDSQYNLQLPKEQAVFCERVAIWKLIMAETARLAIGDQARLTGTKVNTIRFYEEGGLLPQAERTSSGRRIYRDEDTSDWRSYASAGTWGFRWLPSANFSLLRTMPPSPARRLVDCPRPLGRNRRKDRGSLGTTEGARTSDRVLQQRHRRRLQDYRNARAAFPWIGCHSWSLRLALSVSSWTLVRDRTAVAVVFDEDPRCPLSGRSLPCRNDAFGEVSGLSVFQCASHYSR